MKKYRDAIAELGRAQAEVKKLTGYLIKNLQAMQDSQTNGDPGAPWTDWLAEAYKMETREREGPWDESPSVKEYVNHDGDVAFYLYGKCQYALGAHLVIQERKEARKQLAIARRRITLMATHLAKPCTPYP